MAPVSSLSTLTSLALATVLLSSSTISAAVLPNSSVSTKKTTGRTKGKAVSTADQWCTPSFSGLVQTIRKSEQREFVLRKESPTELTDTLDTMLTTIDEHLSRCDCMESGLGE